MAADNAVFGLRFDAKNNQKSGIVIYFKVMIDTVLSFATWDVYKGSKCCKYFKNLFVIVRILWQGNNCSNSYYLSNGP